LAGVLDAFGHDSEAHRVGEGNDGGDYLAVFGLIFEAGDERTVYLQGVEREVLEVRE